MLPYWLNGSLENEDSVGCYGFAVSKLQALLHGRFVVCHRNESDIQCGKCGKEFNSKRNAKDRVMLEFEIEEKGKIRDAKIVERLKNE